jgi:hypothetical protein
MVTLADNNGARVPADQPICNIPSLTPYALSEIIIGYDDKRADAFDEYGRRPWQPEFKDKKQHARDWETFHAFQGEFARLFGPKRRGRSFEAHRLDNEEDSADYHAYHLKLEQTNKKYRFDR